LLPGQIERVTLITHIFTEEIHRFANPLNGTAGIATCFYLSSFTTTPEDISLSTQFDPEIDSLHRFLQGKRPYFRVVGSKSTVFEDGMGEQVGGCHGDLDATLFTGASEPGNNPVPFGEACTEGDKIIIVKIHPVGSQFAQFANDVTGIQRRTDCSSKGISPRISHGPESKGETILRRGGITVRHQRSSAGSETQL